MSSLPSVRDHDPNTLSNYDQFVTAHTTANLTIDFEQKILFGNILLRLKALVDPKKNDLFLDASFLDVQDIIVDGISANWSLLPRTEPYGNALRISLEHASRETDHLNVEVSPEDIHAHVSLSQALRFNRTRSECGRRRIAPRSCGLPLLKPQIRNIHICVSWTERFLNFQAGLIIKLDLVSQCQAIHARSIFPCQDTPAVKSTFEFNIRSSLPVIASGLFTGAKDYQSGKHGGPGSLLYTFKQGIPIPSYLFAIASGWVEEGITWPLRPIYLYGVRDIATASIGPRSSLATGPEELEAAKWELEEDTEHFIQAAEVYIALVDKKVADLTCSLENHPTVLMDYLQCSRTPPKLSLWRNGESEFYVCYANHYIWREFIWMLLWSSVLNYSRRRGIVFANRSYILIFLADDIFWRP